MLWYVKSRRAQSSTDCETWVERGVVPTLNAFDTGDTRATVIVFHPHRSDGARIQGDTINTLTSFMGTGGLNTPMVAVIPIHDKATRYAGKRQMHDGTYSMDGAGNGLGIGKEGDPMNTLTGGDRHALFETSNIRRLTPVECERLQGFPSGWTKEGLSSIMEVCVNINPAIENLLPISDFASSTTKDGRSMGFQNCQLGHKNIVTFAVTGLVLETCATGTTNLGSDTVILYNPAEISLKEISTRKNHISEKAESTSTSLLWNIILEEPLERGKSSTILTLIHEIMTSPIFTSVKTAENISGYTINCNESLPNYSNKGRLHFRMGNITSQADSHRYKQMGNAVTVNVTKWIFNSLKSSIESV